MSYAVTPLSVTFPSRGVVLVTGENGTGKSSVVEAVSVALWGRTLRGTSPWITDAEGQVMLDTDTHAVNRTRSAKNKGGLQWRTRGAAPATFDTQAKAQEALDNAVGDWDVWRRTSVFSSQDAAHFTLATDAERKRLLEVILGLDRFDRASERCRKDLNEARRVMQTAANASARTEAKLQGLRARSNDAERVLATLPPAVDVRALDARLGELATVRRATKKDITALEANIAAIGVEVMKSLTVVSTARVHEELARVAFEQCAIGDCPTCLQPIPNWGDTRDRLAATYAEAQTRVVELLEQSNATVAALRAREAVMQSTRVELCEEHDEALRQEQQQNSIRSNVQRNVQQRATAQATRDTADADVAGAEAVLALESTAAGDAMGRVAELEAVDKVLSLTGVRSHLLHVALGGIEAIANSWLTRIVGLGLQLELKPYAEKSAGGVRDAISLEVVGAGGGHGYRASSGGQRRRIDVALLLALADVAAAAQGLAPGTMFFDEVADSLDAEGVTAIVDVIHELACDRCVVVISHNNALTAALAPTLHLHVNSPGVMTVV